jgi:hypothetical protein
VEKHAALNASLNLIGSLAAIQTLPTVGNTADRDRALASATETALIIAGPVASYAHARRLGDLAAKVRINPSDFFLARLAERITLLQQVHDSAASVLASLAAYGVTEAALAEFQSQIDLANALLGTPRSRIIARRVATEKIAVVFQEMNDLLDYELDPLIASLRKSDPDSYALYQAARVVIARPGSPTATPATVAPIVAEKAAA